MGIAPNSLELLPEAERRGEGDRSLLAVAHPNRRNGGHHRPSGGRQVSQRGRHVSGENPVDLVGPGHG
jgi:hypothetical protein